MRARIVLTTTALLLALPASPALAAKNGEGLVGETNDKVITFFSLGLILFFTLFVILASALQGRLEKRKERRKAALARQRVGW